jgi:hypothetical protein
MKVEEITAKIASGEISAEEGTRLIQQANEKPRGSLYCKVSEKGGVSVYGLQRMPVTLYVEQWERLLDFSDEVRSFLKENASQLKRKEKAG